MCARALLLHHCSSRFHSSKVNALGGLGAHANVAREWDCTIGMPGHYEESRARPILGESVHE